MLYHLADEPTLFHVEGVAAKLGIKLLTFSIPVILWMFRRRWLAWLLIFCFFEILSPIGGTIYAATDCEHARKLLDKSGIARDASENLFGQVRLKPPYGSFPPDMDKITWWGEFKPFEFWESPEFEAVWINPQGQEAGRRKFRGNKCRLAKDTIRAENQPRGEFQPGMWNVIVTCKDYLIDKQAFAVLPAAGSRTGPDTPSRPQESAMIWAKDAVEN